MGPESAPMSPNSDPNSATTRRINCLSFRYATGRTRHRLVWYYQDLLHALVSRQEIRNGLNYQNRFENGNSLF